LRKTLSRENEFPSDRQAIFCSNTARCGCAAADDVLLSSHLRRTSSEAPASAEVPADDPAVTMFPHSKTARWWVSGQDNIISQWHPSFASRYSGPNSFRSQAEHATSNVATLFTGLQLTRTTEIFIHFEAAAGGGLSDALGLAGFTDLDVVRNPTLGTTPYIARGMIRQIIPLSDEMMEEERTPWYLATEVPVRRIELRFGKMGVNDFFDINDIGTDSHSQFMNYNAHVWRGLFAALDLQHINNPGYNRDRGPVVPGLRVHLEFQARDARR
jgi:hypothetical protein